MSVVIDVGNEVQLKVNVNDQSGYLYNVSGYNDTVVNLRDFLGKVREESLVTMFTFSFVVLIR